MKQLYSFLLALLISNLGFGQLSQGDIAIIGVGVDDEAILLVALADIPSGESVFFTDDEWGGSSFNSGEGFYEWITPAITAGSVFTYDASTDAVSIGGTVTQRAGNINLSNSGDGFFVYQTSTNVFNTGTYNIIGFAGEDAGDLGNLTGSGLTLGTNAVYFGGDNGIYNGVRTSNNKAGHLANIYNSTNWVTSGSSQTFDTSSFIISGGGPPAPTVGFDATSSSENETDATFSVNIPITLSNYGGSQVDLSVTVDVNSTAEGGDYTLNTNSLSFTSDGTLDVSLSINDDADNDNETVILNLTETTSTGITISTTQHTVTILDDELPNLVINEILADPDGTTGDANGDGSTSTTQDEFIEIYNASGSEMDLSGYTIEDAVGLRHTFPNKTFLPAGAVIVVFGGGTPTGIPCLTQTASEGFLGLNNGGDSVTIKDGSDTVVVSESYGSEGGSNQSIGKNPDLTGSFVQHSTIVGNSVDFSPGRQNADNIPFSKTWTGATNNDWATASNWDSNSNPTATDDNVWIPNNLTNNPELGTSITVNSVTINPGSSLTVNTGITLNSGKVFMESNSTSYSSLLSIGTINGTFIYNRYTNVIGSGPTGGNDLVAPPVSGQSWSDFLDDNGPSGTNILANNGSGVNAFGPFSQSSGTFSNYTDTESPDLDLINGQGYRAATTAGGKLLFTGDMVSSDVLVEISQSGADSKWNLVGNPFTAYLDANKFLSLAANVAALDPLAVFIYGYNGGATSQKYDLIGPSDGYKVAPGQGFFVASKASSTDNLEFLTGPLPSDDMRSISGGNDFITSRSSQVDYEIILEASKTDDAYTTTFTFFPTSTRGIDPGFDAVVFNDVAPPFAIYSHLVEENTGRDIAIQSLNLTDLNDVTVSLGINASQGEQVTVGISSSDLPANINVYLQDTVENTLTLLNTGDYVFTPSVTLDSTGRFFLVFSANVLSVDDSNLDTIQILSNLNDRTIVISGDLIEDTTASIFDLQGRLVKQVELNTNMRLQSIASTGLTSGVYLVQLSNTSQTKTEKIILN